MTEVASRHTLYYDLLDAFQQDGCPICRLGRLTVARYLDILAYENVNDPGVRQKLRAARGFCNYHAYQFLDEVRDLLGIGIIYRDVVNTIVVALSEGRASGASWPGLPSLRSGLATPGEDHALALLLAPIGPCPACQALEESVTDRLHVLLQHLPESDFGAACKASAGLCYPHFLRALAEAGDVSQLTALVASEEVFLGGVAPRSGHSRPLGLVGSCFGQPGGVSHPHGWREPFGRAPCGPARLDRAGWDNLDPDCCPICKATRSDLAESLEQFARRVASAEDVAAELGLLCHRHAWQLAEARPGELVPRLELLRTRRRAELESAAAELLTQEGLHRGLELPGRLTRARRLGRGLARRLQAQRPCPLCEQQTAVESRALWSYLADGRLSPGMTEGQASGSGDRGEPALPTLCLPHLAQSCHLPLSPVERAELVRRQAFGWNELICELGEYIRKQDYRFRGEPRGHEQTSPRRAVEQMAGRKGIR